MLAIPEVLIILVLLSVIAFFFEATNIDQMHNKIRRRLFMILFQAQQSEIKMISDINCVFQGMGDRGAIYVSGIDAARSLTTLKHHQIGAILSVARGGLVSHQKQDIPHYLYIPADDHESFDLQKSFEDAYKFIDMARKKTNILIHCMAGISRSATITAAYLIKKFGNKTINVIEHLQRKRKRICPNSGFIEQLKTYEAKIRNQEAQKRNLKTILTKNQDIPHTGTCQFIQNDSQNVQKNECLASLKSQNLLNRSPLIEKTSVKNYILAKSLQNKQNLSNPQEKNFSKSKRIEEKIQKVKNNLILQMRKKNNEDGLQFENFQDKLSMNQLLPIRIYRNRSKVNKD